MIPNNLYVKSFIYSGDIHQEADFGIGMVVVNIVG